MPMTKAQLIYFPEQQQQNKQNEKRFQDPEQQQQLTTDEKRFQDPEQQE